MRDFWRVISTLFIWGMAGSVMLASFISTTTNVGSENVVPLVFILSLAAAVSTLAVWFSGQDRTARLPDARGKSKRNAPRRVERLIEQLDDEEIYDLEALLLSREHSADRLRDEM